MLWSEIKMRNNIKLWLVVITFVVTGFLLALPFALFMRLYIIQLSQLLNLGVSYSIAVPLTVLGILLSVGGIFVVITYFDKWFGKTQFITKNQ